MNYEGVRLEDGRVFRTWGWAATLAQLGQIMNRAGEHNDRFLVERNGEPAVLILSVADYVKTFAPPPEWLKKSWDSSKRKGLDKLTMNEIDAEIAASRRQRRDRNWQMIRVVVDALLQPESFPAAVLMRALSGHIQLCVSDEVSAEYGDVIRRPHLSRSPAVIEGTFLSIRTLGHRRVIGFRQQVELVIILESHS